NPTLADPIRSRKFTAMDFIIPDLTMDRVLVDVAAMIDREAGVKREVEIRGRGKSRPRMARDWWCFDAWWEGGGGPSAAEEEDEEQEDDENRERDDEEDHGVDLGACTSSSRHPALSPPPKLQNSDPCDRSGSLSTDSPPPHPQAESGTSDHTPYSVTDPLRSGAGEQLAARTLRLISATQHLASYSADPASTPSARRQPTSPNLQPPSSFVQTPEGEEKRGRNGLGERKGHFCEFEEPPMYWTLLFESIPRFVKYNAPKPRVVRAALKEGEGSGARPWSRGVTGSGTQARPSDRQSHLNSQPPTMFKKPPHTKNAALVKSSDRRKLRADLSSAFPNLPPTSLDLVLPPKEGKGGEGALSAAKFVAHSGDQGTLYLVDGEPVFWRDLDGGFWPSVYTAWKVPDLLPTIMTHGPVMRKLFEGADLMLPGVIVPPTGLPDVRRGEAVAVVVRGNPYPMAIGAMLVSTDDLAGGEGGMRGRGVRTLHVYGDSLWSMGSHSNPPEVNVTDSAPTLSASLSDDWTEIRPDEIDPNAAEVLSLSASISGEEAAEDGEDIRVKDAAGSEEAAISPADMDRLLETALLTALKKTLPNDPKLLPLSSTILYSTYVLPSRPVGSSLDIKQSSYKKLSKFLKAMEKRGWLKLKERGGDTLIVGVNLQHPQIVGFTPPRKVASDAAKKAAAAAANGETAGQGPSSAPDAGKKGGKVDPISVVDLWKGSASVVRMFEEIGKSKDTLYTAAELRSAVDEYAKSKELEETSNR
ncbi:hypothetical protein BDK51DRAFT_34241, partial [Blyttiomyces helicus]